MNIERYMGVFIALLTTLSGIAVILLAVKTSHLLFLGLGVLLAGAGAFLVVREWLILDQPRSPFTGRRLRTPPADTAATKAWPTNGENPRR